MEDELKSLKIIKRRTNLIPVAGLLFAVADYGTREASTILTGAAERRVNRTERLRYLPGLKFGP